MKQALLISILALSPIAASGSAWAQAAPAAPAATPAQAAPPRPVPPTRDPATPGYVTAKELPDGMLPPIDVDGTPQPYMRLGSQLAGFNYTGHPALSVPAGFDERGLPLAVQLVAARWHDGTLLAVARALEDLRRAAAQ